MMHKATARAACPSLRVAARQQPPTARRLSPLPASMDGRALFGAAAASLVLLCPMPAVAGLNRSGNSNAYEEMMAQMQASQVTTSASSLYEDNGGACGPGYELTVVKVIGASCKCVQPELCEKRDDLTQTERSFGKTKKAEGEEDLPFTIAFERD